MYNYSWNTGSTDSLITVSSPGIYQFEATSFNLDTLYISTTLNVLWADSSSFQSIISHPSCGMEDLGSINIMLTDPNDTSTTILWNDGSQEFLLDSLSEGIYNYELTTIQNCVSIGSFSLVETPPFDVQFITSPVTDFQQGSVQLNVIGGVANFTFTLNGVTQGSFIDSLDAGTYEVIVEDANGCIVTVEFVIYDESTAELNDESIASDKIFYKDESVVVCFEEQVETIKVFDMNGKELTLNNEWIEDSSHCFVNFVSLSQGLYHVYIKTNSREFSEMIFVP
jgi:hypothetical protein